MVADQAPHKRAQSDEATDKLVNHVERELPSITDLCSSDWLVFVTFEQCIHKLGLSM